MKQNNVDGLVYGRKHIPVETKMTHEGYIANPLHGQPPAGLSNGWTKNNAVARWNA